MKSKALKFTGGAIALLALASLSWSSARADEQIAVSYQMPRSRVVQRQ